MRWFINNLSLVFALGLLATGRITYLTDKQPDHFITSAGLVVAAVLFFLLWLGQRGKD